MGIWQTGPVAVINVMQVGGANDAVSGVSLWVLLLGGIGDGIRVRAANDIVSRASLRVRVGATNDVVSCISWWVLLLRNIGNGMWVRVANDVVSCVSW